jgi:cyclin-dependent kinase
MVDNTKSSTQYLKLEILGQGAYGVVHKVKHIESGQIYARKKLFLHDEKEGVPSSAIREIAILKELDHINIVKLVDIIQTEKKLAILFEYVETDLKKELDVNIDGLKLPKIKSYLYQLLKGIQYLQDKKILHRDLKPANILTSKDGVLKIADFGLSRSFAINTKNYTNEVVTLYYRPPDVLLGNKNYLTTVDIWSIGCIFAEMVNGKHLFFANQEIDQLKRIFRVFGTPCENNWPEALKYPDWNSDLYELYKPQSLRELIPKLDDLGMDLLEKMLQPNPDKRITISAALNHAFLSDVPNSVLELYK